MNLLTLDSGTMAGMTDEHFIASVEPLIMTPLEKELFKRFAECSLNNEIVEVATSAGFETGNELQTFIDLPECPSKGVLDEPIDDALYLSGMFAEGSEGREIADKLHNYLYRLQGGLR